MLQILSYQATLVQGLLQALVLFPKLLGTNEYETYHMYQMNLRNVMPNIYSLTTGAEYNNLSPSRLEASFTKEEGDQKTVRKTKKNI